jgi:hypothetical protein
MFELLVLGCMLAQLPRKDCARLLGVKKVDYPDYKWHELIELAYTAEDEGIHRFLLLCLHGKRKFLEYFLGKYTPTVEEKLEWELLVASKEDLPDLGKLYRDLKKLKLEEKQAEEGKDSGLADILARIEFELKNPEFPTINDLNSG